MIGSMGMYYYAYTDDIINNNNINSLELEQEFRGSNIFTYSDKKYLIFIPMSAYRGIKLQVLFINIIFKKNKNKYTIPSKKNALIYYDSDDDYYEEEEEEEESEEDRNPLDYNILYVFSSPLKNIKNLGYKELQEYNNVILSNFDLMLPIYVDTNKNEREINIDVKSYTSKFAFSLAVDNNLWKIYKDSILIQELYNKIEDIKELTPFVIRANSDLVELAEYFNLYLSGIQEKIIIYFKKLYGPAEFFECEAEPMDKIDYSILTKPLSSCKNKKSLFNRFINLGNNKILSGYLDYNSYGEAYVDFEDDNNKSIRLSYAGTFSSLIKNFAKYLIKDKEYDLIIESDYLVKLDPEYDADITISGDYNLKLNSKTPIGKLESGNYKIKSSNDAMVYFYGKLDGRIKQVKIENNKGKIIGITVSGDNDIEYLLDFGFEGYMPTNLFFTEAEDLEDNPTLYFENLYEKLQTKLVKNEFLYFYYYDKYDEIKIKINYKLTNLNNPKNDYTFNVITDDEKGMYLIINNKQYYRMSYDINYCGEKKSKVKMFYQRQSDSEEESIIIGEKEEEEDEEEDYYYSRALKLREGIVKLKFESDEDFIFSYSFVDNTDEKFYEYDNLREERIVYKNLIITNITQQEKSNILSLQFNSNYKLSSTRYIVVVAKKGDKYSEENFSNPCFLTKLVTDKAEGVKTINVYSIGEERVINAEIDITEILESNTEYVVNIISQELRLQKKLNYYTPKTFLFGKVYKESSGLKAGYIALIVVGSLIVVAAIVFIAFRCIKKRQNIDFDRKAQEISQEKLLNEI